MIRKLWIYLFHDLTGMSCSFVKHKDRYKHIVYKCVGCGKIVEREVIEPPSGDASWIGEY